MYWHCGTFYGKQRLLVHKENIALLNVASVILTFYISYALTKRSVFTRQIR